MQQTTRQRQIEMLVSARQAIGCTRTYSEGWALCQCGRAYGKPIDRRTWSYWKEKVLCAFDPPELGGMSEASYLLLLTLARLLRGNSATQKSNQVSRGRLATAALSALAGQSPQVPAIPETVSYSDLKGMVEVQALRSYSTRHHRRNGLKASQPFYSREEAEQILSRYPNHRIHHVQQEAS